MADSPLKDSTGVLNLKITCDGAPMPDLVQVLSVETNHSTNRIPYALISVQDGDIKSGKFDISDGASFKPGAAIVIKAGYGTGAAQVLFTGIVVKQALKISGSNDVRLVIECRDQASAMTVGRKNANYVDKDDKAIISTLIGNHGLAASVDATSTTHKELVQYYSTDWDFMLARAEANGLLVTVDAAKVSVKKPDTAAAPVLTLTYGTDLIEFQAELDAKSQLASVSATSWDLASQAIVQKSAKANALTGQGDLASAKLAAVLGAGPFALQTAAPVPAGALTAWAEGQQLKSALARIRGRMRFQGSAKVKPGVLLELARCGGHFNGKVLATNVLHRLSPGEWNTEVEFGMPPYWFAEDHPLQAPEASGLVAGMSGLHIGLVKKLDADPEDQWKIQVSVPLMAAQTDGVWARLASFYASSGFGAFVIPEIGDEVVLGFFNNDPSCPVILGCLYSSKNKPDAAYKLTAENDFKALVTRSKMRVEFDEKKKILTVITPAKNSAIFSDDGKSITLKDQSGNKVVLSESGILLDSPKDITLKAAGNISLTAGKNVDTKASLDVNSAGLNINHKASVAFAAKGAATAELSASGQTTVKGALVMIN